MSCSSPDQTFTEESYRDDTFLKLLADSAGIVAERSLSRDGENGFVYYKQFFNMLPSDIGFEDDDLKQMSDFYNFRLIANSIITGHDTYYRAKYSLGSDSLKLLDAWKNSVDFLRNGRHFYDRIAQKRLEEYFEADIDDLKADTSSISNRNVYDVWDSLTKWFPLVYLSEEERDTILTSLCKTLSPQNFLPKDFPDIYQTYFNPDDTTSITEKKSKLVKCYKTAKGIDQKSACLFTLMGGGGGYWDSNTLESEFVKDAEAIFESAAYTPMLPLLWRAYRCKYELMYSCPSRDCYSYNQRYNYYKRLIAYTYIRHIQSYPEDDMAKIQFFYLCNTDNILKNGEYLYGNQSAVERILLFWYGSVL